MYRLSKSNEAPDRGTEDHGALAKEIASVTSAKLATTVVLMGTGDQLSLPRLERVPLEYCYSAGDSALIALARMLLELDLAAPEQWEPAHHDPGAYILNALKCWIATHGGDSIRRRFDLYVTLTSYLDEYSEKNEENPDGTQLYLTVDPDRCGFVVLGPTLELLESVHPELPATFYHVFAGALNGWVRLYDFRDGEDRVSMLREWVEGEADTDEYEFPDVERCIPPCLRRPTLDPRRLRSVRQQAGKTQVGRLIDAVLDLERTSRQAKRPEMTDEMREELCDTNPPLPSLLAVFGEGDAVEGCFDEDGQTMMENWKRRRFPMIRELKRASPECNPANCHLLAFVQSAHLISIGPRPPQSRAASF
jgi:hypothetical protein